MFLKIKKKLEKELIAYTGSINKLYALNKLSPILFKNIKEFICRDGKRVRPILFCIGYLGFSKKMPSGLYRSALSLELLHDFMLVHDDIIDKSDQRRGKPSMHTLLKNTLGKNKKIKFNGEDLAIVVGDVMYAMALDAFLAIKEAPARKEAALRKLFLAALYTGSGEFIELLLGTKPIEKVTRRDIYKIYDYKTANYTFSSPLTMGAILAGANGWQIKRLNDYGLLLGRAFQIKDDIIGTFGEVKDTGKSNLTDIQEAKRTLLIWYAYHHTSSQNRQIIKRIMENKITQKSQLLKMRKIIKASGAIVYAQNQIQDLHRQALIQINSLGMDQRYKQALDDFSRKILKV
ncbi:MAG TPA: polyprenyl synthetase family protein [Candidatus Omnitrophota bacterium]|nr:polyprenyl synthetase family protein [Candidatus Omnitrophota bacterium]HPT39487.1 polyprenyl synthetase family protein [Candidatus Omnitrophota bacterium]